MKQPNIQLLRALAALLVVHTHVVTEAQSVCVANSVSVCSGLMLGSSGVALFFMISGFIMVTTTWNDFQQPGESVRFLLRRIFRIVPIYWVLTTAVICGALIAPSMLRDAQLDWPYLISSYFFWPVERLDGLVRPVVKLGWTLNLEMMFYALFSLCLLFPRRVGLGLVIICLCSLSGLQMSGIFGPSGAMSSTVLQFWGDAVVLNFVTGIAVGMAHMRGVRSGFSLPRSGVALCALAVVSISVTVLGARYVHYELLYKVLSSVPLLVFFAIAVLGPQADASKVWWKTGLVLGNASYSIYLIHPFVLRVVSKVWERLASGEHILVFQIVGFAAAILVGVLVYVLVEKPLTKLFAPIGRGGLDSLQGQHRASRMLSLLRPAKM